MTAFSHSTTRRVCQFLAASLHNDSSDGPILVDLESDSEEDEVPDLVDLLGPAGEL